MLHRTENHFKPFRLRRHQSVVWWCDSTGYSIYQLLWAYAENRLRQCAKHQHINRKKPHLNQIILLFLTVRFTVHNYFSSDSVNLASICFSLTAESNWYMCRPPPRLRAKQRQQGKLTLSQAIVANTTQQHKTIHKRVHVYLNGGSCFPAL